MSGATRDQLAACDAWRDAAEADGWTIEPTYSSELLTRAATLKREGYVAMVLTRDYPNGHIEAHVSVWGPDGLAIIAGFPYSWADVVAGASACSECGAAPVETVRVGFAGRVCKACRPAVAKVAEFPGWND